MRKIVKRIAAAASAVVIGGVSCVTTWFSVPAAAAGGFGWLEWAEFQSLLQGVGFSSGGGSYKSVQEATLDWLNMTSDQFYKLTDPTDGGNAKPIWEQSWWGDMTDWLDNVVHSWSEDYSGIADVGADVSGGGGYYPSGISCSDGVVRFSSDFFISHKGEHFPSDSYPYFDVSMYKSVIRGDYLYLICVSPSDNDRYIYYLLSYVDNNVSVLNDAYSYLRIRYSFYDAVQSTGYLYDTSNHPISSPFSSSVFCSMLDSLGCNHFSSLSDAVSALQSASNWVDKSSVGDDFLGPVYTYPAAQDLYKSTGTAAGIRLDVQTQDGVPDLQAALDGAGVDTVDDLVAGVAAGTVPMSKVFSDSKVTPYVVADTTAGTVVTDLGVSATATGVKAVGLTQDLAVPKDLTNAATYVVKGKTWDPEMSKYKLPLFQYFPFCLPWDIYQVLAAFSADPVAPVFDIPVGKILSGVRSADVSKAASLSAKIDFGDDNWSKVFEVIRILECAGIIVGLCLVAVYLIHGGR